MRKSRVRLHPSRAESAENSLSSVASCQKLAQTVEASSTVRGSQAAVELPPTLQIIDKQWDPRCCEPSTHWNCACFMQSRAGMESSAETTNIWEMVCSGITCLSRTLPLAISIGARRNIDTSSANRAESRRGPHSTSARERPLEDWKSRLPATFPPPCHLHVHASVLGETA